MTCHESNICFFEYVRLESPNVYLCPMMGKVKEAVYSPSLASGCSRRAVGRGSLTCSVDQDPWDLRASAEVHATAPSWTCPTLAAARASATSMGTTTGARVVFADAFHALHQPETVFLSLNPRVLGNSISACSPLGYLMIVTLAIVAHAFWTMSTTVVLRILPITRVIVPAYVMYAAWVFRKWEGAFPGQRFTRMAKACPSNSQLPDIKRYVQEETTPLPLLFADSGTAHKLPAC